MDELKEQICEILFKRSEYTRISEIDGIHQLHERQFDNVSEDILSLLEQRPETRPHETIVMWRIVEDNPPPLDEIVWLFDGFKTWIGGRAMVDSEYWLYGNTYGSIWHNGKKWDGDLETDDDYKPILWKPLPEPPQDT